MKDKEARQAGRASHEPATPREGLGSMPMPEANNTILTLSGWTQPADAVARVLPMAVSHMDYSEYPSPDAALEVLATLHAQTEHVIAWSMGGLLAVRAIEAGVIAPQKLTLIAPPYQFVNDDRFNAGMDPATFNLFRENYVADAARSKTRFHGLIAKGDARLREVMAQLTHHTHVENVPRWLPWLDDLASYSHTQSTHAILPDTQLIQGSHDAIVPAGQALAWQQHYPQVALHLWENVGHAPHLHDTQRFLQQINAHHGEIV